LYETNAAAIANAEIKNTWFTLPLSSFVYSNVRNSTALPLSVGKTRALKTVQNVQLLFYQINIVQFNHCALWKQITTFYRIST
jgi:hypothetical protein